MGSNSDRIIMTNGLKIQWGTFTGSDAQSLQISYSNANYSLVLIAINRNDTCAVYYKTSTSFTPPRNGTYNYIAIGY